MEKNKEKNIFYKYLVSFVYFWKKKLRIINYDNWSSKYVHYTNVIVLYTQVHTFPFNPDTAEVENSKHVYIFILHTT